MYGKYNLSAFDYVLILMVVMVPVAILLVKCYREAKADAQVSPIKVTVEYRPSVKVVTPPYNWDGEKFPVHYDGVWDEHGPCACGDPRDIDPVIDLEYVGMSWDDFGDSVSDRLAMQDESMVHDTDYDWGERYAEDDYDGKTLIGFRFINGVQYMVFMDLSPWSMAGMAGVMPSTLHYPVVMSQLTMRNSVLDWLYINDPELVDWMEPF